MPNTTNFNFPTPADTDLVKDGAAAIRSLGNSIDSAFVDLKGGTTGQILTKATNTDLDYTWTTPNVGDITEVQAGTGISVASGTGPIPIVTNTVATTFDAKGDLVVGTGADTFAKLTSSGVNNEVLMVDTATATGLKWAAVDAGGMTSLATGSISGSAINLTSISGSYIDLYLVLDGWAPNTNTGQAFLQFNADTGANRYRMTNWNGIASASQTFNETRIDLSSGSSNTATTQRIWVKIPNYAKTGIWKTCEINGISTSTASSNANNTIFGGIGVYNQTGAITQINLTTNTTFVSQGTYTLYGVK